MWYISKDKIDDGEAVGQYNCAKDVKSVEDIKPLCKEKFRMSDDDDEVYYIGYSNNSSSFAPLDDFGMPNAGCTSIEYYENGKWEYL